MKTKKEVKRMQATQVRIDPESHRALRVAAIEAGISMNQAINQAVEMWLKGQGAEKMKSGGWAIPNAWLRPKMPGKGVRK